MIRELLEDWELLQAWAKGLGLHYRGQRLASLSFKAFSTLVKAPRITPSQRQKKLLLAEQGGKCAACGQQIGAGCAEFDHIVPVRQAFAGQQQRFQALCFECHQMKTQTESMQPTLLESRFTRSVYDAYVRSPKQPPLVFQARAPGSGPLEGVDAPFPLPIFLPGRQHRAGAARAPRRPLVCGPAKSGARCPRDAAALRGAGLVPEGLGGLHAAQRRGAVVRRAPHDGRGQPRHRGVPGAGAASWSRPGPRAKSKARSELDDRAHGTRQQQGVHAAQRSSNELDATGADTRQVFYVGEGRYVWDFITARSIHNNGTLRPIHDCVLGFEATMVARIRRELGLPPKYIKQVKTDCVVLQHNLERLIHNTYPDGKPKFRHEETTKLMRGKRPPCMQAGPPARAAGWTDVADPVAHWLTGLPAGKTHLARIIVTKLREERGEVVHLLSKTHSAVQNLGAKTADHWVRKYTCGGPACSAWTGSRHGPADIACVSLNHDVRFLLAGDFRQLPAVLDTWGGTPVNKPLRHSQLTLDLAGGWRHELTENKRSNARIFDLVRSLRVDEPDKMPLQEALQTAQRLFPRKPGVPDTTLTISHAQRMAINADANRRLAPAIAQLVEPEEDPDTAEQNKSQPMRVWPGLKLIGAGGAIKKGTFVTVAAASSQGLTLQGRVHLDTRSKHFTLRHLYTSGNLLKVV